MAIPINRDLYRGSIVENLRACNVLISLLMVRFFGEFHQMVANAVLLV